VSYSSLESPTDERQPLGTMSAIRHWQLDGQHEKSRRWEKGTDTMASWLMIIFGYVIIAVGVFNLLGPGSHLLY